ncbi:MAG: TIGR03943 family protein [Chloroflexota bacterium]
MTTFIHDEHDISRSPQQFAKAFILLGLGLYFCYNIFAGQLSNYINTRFMWLSWVAAGLFLLLGVFALYAWWTNQSADHSHHDHGHAHGDDCDHDDHHHHDHDYNISWKVIAVCAFPLVMGTLVPSQPLGVEAINGEVAISAVPINSATAADIDPLERNILDWIRLFGNGNPTAYAGEPVDLIGFVYREPDFAEDQLMVVRFTVSCCVADSSAVGLPVEAGDISLADIPDGEWVRVQGNIGVSTFQGQESGVVLLSSIEITEQPATPYLNP